jgi:hypothetical protein
MESSPKPGISQRDCTPQAAGHHDEALLRLSESLSQCRDPEELTKILTEQLSEFLDFLQFYIIVYKQNSQEVEWAVVGQEKNLAAGYANVPVEQRPSWQANATQQPVHIRDWNTDERIPARLKEGIANSRAGRWDGRLCPPHHAASSAWSFRYVRVSWNCLQSARFLGLV